MALCSGLGTGCHATDPADGTTGRLVSWRLETESGDSRPLVLGIYDRALDTPCRFVSVEDGTTRCLPFSEQAGPLSTLFADERCEHMLFQWVPARTGSTPEKMPSYLSVPGPSACPLRYTPRTAQAFDRSGTLFEQTASGGCRASAQSVTQNLIRNREFLVAGEPVPLSRFAVGSRVSVPPPTGQRLGVVQFESPDGGPFPVGLHDRQWQRTCIPESTGNDGELLCWPPYAQDFVGRFVLFAEKGCVTPLAAHQPDDAESCADPVLVRGRTGTRRIGERWTAPYYAAYDTAGQTCAAAQSFAVQRVFGIGPELAPGAIAALRSQVQGTGPLRAISLTTDDGRAFDLPVERWNTSYGRNLSIAAKSPLFQDAAAKPCAPYRASDGTVRCLPLHALEPLPGIYFADAACAQPLALCTDCAGKDVLVPLPGRDPFGAAAVHEFGPRFTGQAFASDGNNGCAPYDPAMSTKIDLRTLGAQVSWDRYPKLAEWRGTERIGP